MSNEGSDDSQNRLSRCCSLMRYCIPESPAIDRVLKWELIYNFQIIFMTEFLFMITNSAICGILSVSSSLLNLLFHGQIQRGWAGDTDPSLPRKSQVAIGFIRNNSSDPSRSNWTNCFSREIRMALCEIR